MAEIIDDITSADTGLDEKETHTAKQAIVTWVMGKVNPWRAHREANYDARWEEYYRMWRGIWASEDVERKSERSRLISPALSQAVESVTSEIESAVLDQGALFDIVDDTADTAAKQDKDMVGLRAKLREDMKETQFDQSLNQIFLNGSIFGTGLGKLDVEDVEVMSIKAGPDGRAELGTSERTQVELTPMLPQSFVIDIAAKSINEGLGAAHEYTAPTHSVREMQDSGVYLDSELKVAAESPLDPIESDTRPDYAQDSVNITDYRGKVPLRLIRALELEQTQLDEDEELDDLFSPEVDETDETLVEAFIVIGNGNVLLKAKENTTLLKERLFLAYRHEIVPDQFWGRGVCEKGYNPQKALDGSVRARMDGLALTVHPMMAIDGSRMPKGFRFSVRPGRTIVTQGAPGEILQPINFGQIDPNIFTDNAELERMVSQATGGSDTAAPTKANNRNETASGMSMQLGSFVKRSKRTIRNIENEFIVPMVKTVSNLFMQFAPERYPATDVTFRAVSMLGNMARELEQQQFTFMLQTTDASSPAYWLIMRSIYESSDLKNREQMLEFIDIELDKVLNPPPPPEDPLLKLKEMEVTAKIKAEHSRIQVEYIRAQAEIARAANDARTAESEEAKNESQAILNLAKAEAQAIGSQKDELSRWLTELETESMSTRGLADDAIRNATATTTATGTGGNAGDSAVAGI